MKIHSDTIIQDFKPIRVSIDLESAEEMATIAWALRQAYSDASPRRREVITQLLPAFTRL